MTPWSEGWPIAEPLTLATTYTIDLGTIAACIIDQCIDNNKSLRALVRLSDESMESKCLSRTTDLVIFRAMFLLRGSHGSDEYVFATKTGATSFLTNFEGGVNILEFIMF